MERRFCHPWNLPTTRRWLGTFSLENNIVKREFLKQVNSDVQLAYLFLHPYYVSHGPIDIAYDAAKKFCNPYSLLILSKYLYDVDGSIVFSSVDKMNYFFACVEYAAEDVYNNIRRYFAILYICYFISLVAIAVIIFRLMFQYI